MLSPMRRTLLAATALSVSLLAGLASHPGVDSHAASMPCLRAMTAVATYCGAPRHHFALEARVTPRRLPRVKSTPVRLDLLAKVGTNDGTQPSALRELAMDVGREMEFDADGVAVCRYPQIRGKGPRAARRVCRGSVVGGGLARVQIASAGGEQSPPRAVPLTAFNGGEAEGKMRLLVHGLDPWVVGSRPFVATIIDHARRGEHVVVRIPRIASGSGSVLSLKLRLGRSLNHRGTRRSYLRSSCPRSGLRISVPKALLIRELPPLPGAASRAVFRGNATIPCRSSQ